MNNYHNMHRYQHREIGSEDYQSVYSVNNVVALPDSKNEISLTAVNRENGT